MNPIDVEYIRSRLAYDAAAGTLVWKYCESAPRQWNSRLAGKPAFTALTSQGYPHGTVGGRNYTAHRLAWAIHHGSWPENQIDHINGVRSDYRMENLRDVTVQANRCNMARPRHNTSGVVGVSQNKITRRWVAYVGSNATRKSLGAFHCIGQAIKARADAAAEFGMHPNHGRVA